MSSTRRSLVRRLGIYPLSLILILPVFYVSYILVELREPSVGCISFLNSYTALQPPTGY